MLVAISPREVEVPVGVPQRTWDSGLKSVNKHHRHHAAAAGDDGTWCGRAHYTGLASK